MYTFAIYLYMLCVDFAAFLGNKKARLMVRGHRKTWKILRENIGPDDAPVWFHAASLGEFEQGRPLIERLRREHPGQKILLTFFSPSGYEVRKHYKGADVVCYLPLDTALNARKFLRLAHPSKAFFIKYEFWLNYLSALHRAGVPTYSVSSIFRRGQIFFRWYGRQYADVLRKFTHLFVQNEASQRLLQRIGVTDVTVAGDTRFARVLDIRNEAKQLPIVEAFASDDRPVLVAGSTWPPDEDIIINYFNRHPELRLVLAPHVVSEEHLREIKSKLHRPLCRYMKAAGEDVSKADCLVIDCYGLLSSMYRYADVAYVGGGFGVGIHNVPEAAVFGVPVIIGPNNRKFREAKALLRRGGCREVRTQQDFDAQMDRYLSDVQERRKDGETAAEYIRENAGAADLVFDAALR